MPCRNCRRRRVPERALHGQRRRHRHHAEPGDGELIKQGRLTGALGAYYSSPVAAGGYLYFTSERGAVAVLPPGGDLTPMVVNDLAEDTYATPAFADGKIYIRTVEALYAFGMNSPSPQLRIEDWGLRIEIADCGSLIAIEGWQIDLRDSGAARASRDAA